MIVQPLSSEIFNFKTKVDGFYYIFLSLIQTPAISEQN